MRIAATIGFGACLFGLMAFGQAVMGADGPEGEGSGENASNPLAKVKNTDVRWQYLDLDGPEVNDVWVEGAFMAHPKLKIRYELHYWDTDVTGQSEHDWESFLLKAIYFPAEGDLGQVTYRAAMGCDWIVDLGDQDKGIGSGSDEIGPFVGLALTPKLGTTLIPLVQHFLSYDGNSVNTTGFRLIALQRLAHQMWVKLDAVAPVDWQNDDSVPANAELQLGKNITRKVGAYLDGLVGVGGDKPFDWGMGIGLRVNY